MKNTVYNEDQLHQHLQTLMPEGYTMNSDGQFIKNETENNRRIMLSYGFSQRFPFGVNFFGFGVDVGFLQVEEIIHIVRKSHPNLKWGHSLDSTTFYRGFSNSVLGRQFILENVNSVLVEDDKSFEKVKPYLQQMLEAALNFLETNQTLQQFYELAEKMPIEEMADFYNQPLPPRRIIVRRLLNEPYEEMATALINKYTQRGRIEDSNFAIDLKNYLDKL